MSKSSVLFISAHAHHPADPFRLLVESVVDYAIYMVDPTRLVASWNPGAERIYGYRAEEIIGQPFSTVFSPSDLAIGRPDEVWQLALASGHYEYECVRVRKDRSEFWAVVTVSTLKDHFGIHAGFSVVTRDITEKRLAEQALKESEEAHRRLLEFLPDAVFVNSENRIAYCNSAFVHLLGATDGEALLGRPALSIFHPKYHDTIRERIETIQDHNGTVPVIEEEVVRLDGSHVPVEVAATAITHQGRPSILVVMRDLGQRKDIERRFRAMIEGIKDYAIYTMDSDGMIASWNEGAGRIFGFTADEVLGRHRSLLFTLEDVSAGAVQAELDRAAALGSASEERWRIRKDGSRFWANGVMTVIRDGSGAVCGYVKIVRDLTERRQAEMALNESEERYRNLFNAIADPLFVYDRETLAYLAVNNAAVRTYGYGRDEFEGMTIKDIRPVEDISALLAMLAASGNALEERGVWRHIKKDGAVIDVEISAHGLDYAGRPACVVQARDVTEKRRAAAEVAQANDLLRAVVEGTPDALFVKDRSGKYLLFNSAASRFVGKSPEDVLGRNDTALFDPESARAAMEHDQRVIATNQADTEEEHLTAAGVTRTYLATKMPFKDSNGNVVGVLGISRDITDRKRADDALRQQQTLLRIAGRVARLGGWSLDLESQKVTWSDEICVIHEVPAGYQPGLEEAIEFYPPEYREQVARFVQDCIEKGAPFDFELELITAKGRRIWVRAIGEAVRDDTGQIVGLQGAFQDISDRKKAQDEKRRLTERLATTLETMTDGFCFLDRDWRITYVNAEAERMILQRREDLIGRSHWDVFPDTLGMSFEREYRRAIAEQVAVDFEEYFAPLAKWFGVRAYPSEQGLAVYFRDVTAARKLTAELVEERSRLVAAQAVAKVGSWETDLSTLDVVWSAETYRIFEQPEGQFHPTHQRFLQLVHPEDRDAVDREFRESLHLRDPQRIEHRIVMPDGRIKVVEEHWQANFDPQGKALRVTGTCQDITERKLAEQAVRDSVERFRLVSKATNDAIWDWDLTTDSLWWNEGFETLFGYVRSEVESTCLSWRNRVHFADREAVLADVDRAIHGDAESWAGEYRFVRKDGTEAFVLDRGYIIREPAGKAVRMIGGMTDLTARKRAEESLLLRDRAIRAVSQGILITDPNQVDNPVIYASEGFERMTGYSLDEVIGKNCRFLQGKDTDADTVRELRTAIAAARSCSVEILNYRKDGTSFWNQLTITPVLGPAGQLTHFVGVQTDVTERRRLEEQFRQAQKMEAVGQLAGGVAHDFNNLLTIINGYSDLLLDQLGHDDPMRELLSEIHQAGERAGTLTRQLLAFSRQQVLEPRVIHLNGIVRDSEKMLRRLIGENILLSTTFGPNVGQVKADPGQIEQVLMNLVVNARDAMPKGGNLIIETQSVRLDESYCQGFADLSPGAYVLLAVSDTGVGMDEATQARIFEPFFTTKELGKGTGLGLATVHGILKQSRGHIAVYSEVGRGTTFKVYLPQIAESPDRVGADVASRAMPRGSETVLLVEDEDAVRALATHVLRGCGYNVIAANNGKEAIRCAESESGPIHLMVSDVVMPHLGGADLVARIVAKRPECRVLFVSGYTNDAVLRHGILEGEYAFLQKPFAPTALAQKVRQVLDASPPPGGLLMPNQALQQGAPANGKSMKAFRDS